MPLARALGLPLDGITRAHGLGGPKDLPIPLGLALAGAVAALVVSFTVLVVAWREPRYAAPTSGIAVPLLSRVVHSPAYAVVLRLVGLALFGFAAMCAVLGQDLLINPFFGMFYVWWWVGLVPASLLLGPVWKAISPVRSINWAFARVSGSDPGRGVFEYPPWLGHWPAAAGLFAFVWLELVYPHSGELSAVRLWASVYLALMLVGGALFGSPFYERADPFEVYSTLVGRLSVWGHRDGRLVVRSPLANLATIPTQPGLVAVVAVLFGSTGFDSFQDSVLWISNVSASAVPPYLLSNLGLLLSCGLVGAVFATGCMLTGVGPEQRRRSLPDQLAHSIVPIIVGYVAAHYLTYLVEVGQQTLQYASDPLSRGEDWFGTADWEVNYWLSYHPTLLALIKVGAVVVGHVVAVVAAHDRSVLLLPRRHQLIGQLPLLVAMILFTVGGLLLLFSP